MQLSTLPGSEKLSLLIHPKVEGSALAPLEEAPPSWLQPARPLCAPAALLMPPTRLHLQYAAKRTALGVRRESSAGGTSSQSSPPGSAQPSHLPSHLPSHPGSAQPRQGGGAASSDGGARVVRRVSVEIAPIIMEASATQLVSTHAVLEDVLSRALETAPTMHARQGGSTAPTPSPAPPHLPSQAPGTSRASARVSARPLSPPSRVSARPFFHTLAMAPEPLAPGGGVASSTASGPPSQSQSGPLHTSLHTSARQDARHDAQSGSLLVSHDLSFWTTKLLRKLQLLQSVTNGCMHVLTTAPSPPHR